MARRKGLKKWDRITEEGWLMLMGDTSVMSRLMMDIFDRLYDSTDHMDNGKSIAAALHMEYRALNSAVGWAGGKIRDMAEKGTPSPVSGRKEGPKAEKISAPCAGKPGEGRRTATGILSHGTLGVCV